MPTTMWAKRIANCDTIKKKVELHVERWGMWDTFIEKFAGNKTIKREKLPVQIDEKQETQEKEFQKALDRTGARWSTKQVGNVLFDASFGSLNSTSDLDINVLSPDTKVLEAWKKFIQEWHIKNPGEVFTNYYDSNFYFEPCNESMQSLRLALVNDGFKFTTEKSYGEEFKVVKAYTEAYRSGGKYEKIYPNPTNMAQQDEITYYTECGTLARNFVDAVNSEKVEDEKAEDIRSAYLKFAACKIEGIISIPALAICGVFGKAQMENFMNKKTYDNEKALQIAVYEMLCNLRMHAHIVEGTLEFKSKYANRLINLLKKNKNICKDNTYAQLTKTNNATMEEIKLAMVFLLDYLDGIGPCHIHEYEDLQYNIDKVIDILEKKINDKTIKVTQLTRLVSSIKLRF